MRWSLHLATTTSALLALCLIPPATPAVAAPASDPVSVPTRINDIDGDGKVDVVGLTDLDGPPAVAVVFGDGRIQSVTATQLGDRLHEDSTFGIALAVGDLDSDGYADIVVSDSSGPRDYRGIVWALWGSADGISAKRSTVLARGRAGDLLGRALAFVPGPEPVLAVGDQASRAGGVRLYPVRAGGRLGTPRRITIGSPGIVGQAVEDAGFGESLAASGDLLVIGAADAGPVEFSGAAYVLQLRPGLRYWATRVIQGSRGVPGRPQRLDAFGRSVSVLGDRVAIGSDDRVGRHEAAGTIQVVRVERTGHGLRIHPGPRLTQASPGVPGRLGAHDFGAELLVTKLCARTHGVIAAGSGTRGPLTVPFSNATRCPGRRLDGAPHGGSQSFAVLRTRPSGTAGEEFVLVDGTTLVFSDGTSLTRTDLTGTPADGLGALAPPAA